MRNRIKEQPQNNSYCGCPGKEPGKSAKDTITLKPGRYAIICNVLEQEPSGEMEAHYSMGMHTVLNVE